MGVSGIGRSRGMAPVVLYAVIYLSYLHAHLQSPLISPYAASLGAGLVLTGFIVGSYSLTNILGNLAAGHYIDTLGRRVCIMAGLALAGLSVLLYGLAPDSGWLLVFRLLHGLAGGILVPATLAYVGDVAPEGQQGRSMGFYGAAIGIAAVTGPLIGGFARGRFGFTAVFQLTFVLSLIGLLAATLYLRETLDRTGGPRESGNAAGRWAALRSALTRQRLVASYLLAFTMLFNKGVLALVLPLRADAMGLAPAVSGAFFATYGMTALLVQALPTNRLSDRVGREGPGMGGALAMGLALLTLSFVHSPGAMFATMGLFGLGFGAGFPAVTATVADATHPRERGTAAGVFAAVYSLGVVIGPPLTAWLAGPLGPAWGHPFRTAAAVTALVVGTTALVLGGRRPARTLTA